MSPRSGGTSISSGRYRVCAASTPSKTFRSREAKRSSGTPSLGDRLAAIEAAEVRARAKPKGGER